MLKRITLVTCGGALLLAGACDTTSGPDCQTIVNNTQSTVADTVITSSGLRYVEVVLGTGTQVRTCEEVAVRYTGLLTTGSQFDTGSLAFTPGLGGLIDGFEQGVIGMRVGGKRRLIIPPNLGYGSADQRNNQGVVVIPGNSTIIFDVEILAAN